MLLSAELVFRAWNDLELFQRLDYKTLQLVQTQQSFDGNPLYAVLHEPIYCQGYVNFINKSPSSQCNQWLLSLQARTKVVCISYCREATPILLVARQNFIRFRTTIFHWRNGVCMIKIRGTQQSFREGTHNCFMQIFPDMFDDYANLRPLKGVAEILANDDSWGPLYDLEQLAKNEVKVTAAT